MRTQCPLLYIDRKPACVQTRYWAQRPKQRWKQPFFFSSSVYITNIKYTQTRTFIRLSSYTRVLYIYIQLSRIYLYTMYMWTQEAIYIRAGLSRVCSRRVDVVWFLWRNWGYHEMNLTIEAGRRELTLYIRVLVYNLTCVVVVVVVAIVMMRIYGGLYYCNKILHKKNNPTNAYIYKDDSIGDFYCGCKVYSRQCQRVKRAHFIFRVCTKHFFCFWGSRTRILKGVSLCVCVRACECYARIYNCAAQHMLAYILKHKDQYKNTRINFYIIFLYKRVWWMWWNGQFGVCANEHKKGCYMYYTYELNIKVKFVLKWFVHYNGLKINKRYVILYYIQ